MTINSEWEWLQQPPPKVRKLREPPPRDRWLTVAQADALVAALPPTIADMACMALETGLRRSNVCGLQWDWVNLAARRIDIPAAVMKSRRPHAVTLTSRALATLQRWSERRADGCALVFHRNGKAINQPNGKAWLATLARLGLADFRWHDLRHTWASWQAQAGTDVQVLRMMGAWKTLHMVGRYAHLDLAAAQAASGRLDLWRMAA